METIPGVGSQPQSHSSSIDPDLSMSHDREHSSQLHRHMPNFSRTAVIAAGLALVAAVSCTRERAQPAPDTVRVRFETSKGPFVVEAYRDWSPHGVDRFDQLTRMGYYNGVRFFRVLDGFMAQFGLSGDPGVTAAWHDRSIPDDPVTHSNKRGTVSFATRGPNTRTTQLFINYRDNVNLDGMGFTPIGVVTQGMNVVDSLYSGYGEGAPDGSGPDQIRAESEGNAYLQREFPKLDYVIKATVLTPPRPK
jgi:peptidyl-prolyl cis-trans isomerase A (cyclophilin A)